MGLFYKRGLGAACLLAALATALPASAFIGNLRGPKADGELALPGLSAPVRVLVTNTAFRTSLPTTRRT